jgi:hypothetical protein
MTKEERLLLIEMASAPLFELIEDVCPACKKGEMFNCEAVEGVYVHPESGECKASPILELCSHLDDVRHQFANEFNPEEKARLRWVPTRISK